MDCRPVRAGSGEAGMAFARLFFPARQILRVLRVAFPEIEVGAINRNLPDDALFGEGLHESLKVLFELVGAAVF